MIFCYYSMLTFSIIFFTSDPAGEVAGPRPPVHHLALTP